MIEVKEGRYFLGMFFANIPKKFSSNNKGGDIMICVWRNDNEPLDWTMDLRFRWNGKYETATSYEQIEESDDVKSWYKVSIKSRTESEVMKEMYKLVSFLSNKGIDGIPFYVENQVWWEVKGGVEEFARKMEKDCPPFMHRSPALTLEQLLEKGLITKEKYDETKKKENDEKNKIEEENRLKSNKETDLYSQG